MLGLQLPSLLPQVGWGGEMDTVRQRRDGPYLADGEIPENVRLSPPLATFKKRGLLFKKVVILL